MNVVNDRTQRFNARDVPVVTAAWLPEAVPQARPFAHRHPSQPLRRVAFQVADRLAGHGLLHRLQKTRHPLRAVSGIDKNMNVLRHQDVSPELKTELGARFVERLAKPRARPIAASYKTKQPALAGKGKGRSAGWPGLSL